MENLSNKVDGNSIPASEWNQSQGELKNFLTSAGISLDGADLAQLGQAVAALGMGNAYYVDQNVSADVYDLLAVSGREAADVYIDGMYVMFRPLNASTGTVTATVQIGTLGDRDIKREDGTDILLNDLVTGRDTMMRFSAAANQFFILNPYILTDAETALPEGQFSGFLHSNGTDTDHDIDVAGVGECRDDADTQNLSAIALTKQIDVTWGEGTNDGGYPDSIAGLAIDTWYRFFVVAKPDGTTDYGWDLEANANASGLLADTVLAAAGYTKFRQIGWHLTDGSSNIIAYIQYADDPDFIQWVTLFNSGAIATHTSQVASTVEAPPGSFAQMSVAWGTNSGATLQMFALIIPTDVTDQSPTGTRFNFAGHRDSVNDSHSVTNMTTRCDSSSQVGIRWSSATDNYSYCVFGFGYKR